MAMWITCRNYNHFLDKLHKKGWDERLFTFQFWNTDNIIDFLVLEYK